MKGRYKQYMLSFRVVMLLVLIYFIYKLVSYFPTSDFSVGTVLYTGFIGLLIILVLSALTRSLLMERFTFHVLNDGINVVDLLSRRKKFIPYHALKGFSTGTFKRRFDTHEQVILYCRNGDVYPIVDYNFYNFRTLRKTIKQQGNIPFLGREKLNWTLKLALKDLIFKQYTFR